VHAATGAPLAPPPWAEDPGTTEGAPAPGIAIDVEAPDLCPRFTARVFENVRIGPSPAWLRGRLMAAGQRPINNVVDITNYVMLLTGHPLHAFDLDRVAGGRLTVRRAREGERITTLDDVERVLDVDVCVIEDAEGPTSIAGIMGGARSEVHPGTTRVLLEVATWDGPNIHRTSSKLGLRSEASGRFEKGLSPEGALEAQAVASQLLIDLAGATLVPGTVDVGGPGPEPQVIRLREQRVASLLGAPVARERQAEILTALGFGVAEASDGLDVTVPHFRRLDVTREADLIEEVARIDGVDRLPATLPSRRGAVGVLTPEQRLRRRAEDALAGRGLLEIAGWSFTDPGLADRLRLPADDRLRAMVRLENPLSEAQSVLRPTILGSLLDAARHNVSRGVTDLGLFESGTVYRQGVGPLADEHHALAALLTGDALRAGSWRGDGPPPADFFVAKGVLASVLDALRVPWTVEPAEWAFLHPGRSAAVLVGGERVGFLGEVHPLVAREWELEQAVAVFAVDLGRVIATAPEVVSYRDLMSFPAVRQDLAVLLADDVPAARVVEVVRQTGGKLVEHVEVFDVYAGEQLGEGRRSLALHLELRAPDRTLTDEDVAPVRERIVAALAKELGGELRG
jgi:phenylalanyl-tRNA synthetase beta chain